MQSVRLCESSDLIETNVCYHSRELLVGSTQLGLGIAVNIAIGGSE